MTRSSPVLVEDYGRGLDATSSPDGVDNGLFIISRNMRYKPGAAYVRTGDEEFSVVGTGSPIKNACVQTDFDILFVNSGTKIMYTQDGVYWYDTGLTRTASQTDGMLSHTKDMFVNNQVEGLVRIACSTLSADQSASGTTLNVQLGDGTNFSTSGSGRINDIAITWTGVTGDQLTGVSGLSADVSEGDVLIETTAIGSVKGTMMAELEGSMLVAGNAEFPDTVYYSAPSTVTAPEYFWDFTTANGGGSKKLSGTITALYGASDIVIIGFKDKLKYSNGFLFDSSATLSGLLTDDLSKTDGVPNKFCVSDMEGELIINTGRRILPVLANKDGAAVVKDQQNQRNNLDFGISGYMRTISGDQSGAYIHFDKKRREICARVNNRQEIPEELNYSQSVANGLAWSVDTGRPYGLRFSWKGEEYGASDEDDTIYKLTDSSTDHTVPIVGHVLTGHQSINKGIVTGDVHQVVFTGLLSPLGEFTFRVIVDGEVEAEELVTAEELQRLGLMSTTDNYAGFGSESFGSAVFGSGTALTLRRFTFPYEIKLSGERVQFEFMTAAEGTQMELHASYLERDTESFLELTNY